MGCRSGQPGRHAGPQVLEYRNGLCWHGLHDANVQTCSLPFKFGVAVMRHDRGGPTTLRHHLTMRLQCMLLQEGLVPFNIGVAVRGDITLGVWFGHRNLGQRLHSRAAFSFAFHTAFVESGADRVQLPMLDISNKVGLYN